MQVKRTLLNASVFLCYYFALSTSPLCSVGGKEKAGEKGGKQQNAHSSTLIKDAPCGMRLLACLGTLKTKPCINLLL